MPWAMGPVKEEDCFYRLEDCRNIRGIVDEGLWYAPNHGVHRHDHDQCQLSQHRHNDVFKVWWHPNDGPLTFHLHTGVAMAIAVDDPWENA